MAEYVRPWMGGPSRWVSHPKRRVIIIEEYEVAQDTWGSAPHTCPLTEAKPGEAMCYYCPTCSGHVTC